MTDLASPPDGRPPDDRALDRDDAGDAVAAQLRRAAALADPVPAAWRSVARGAYAWLGAAGEPARLVYDARAAASELPSSVQASAPRRSLRFVADGWGPDAVVELDLDIGPDTLALAGRVRPARAVPVTVVFDDVPTAVEATVEATADGAFRVDELPRRPFYLLVGGVMGCKTAWVVT